MTFLSGLVCVHSMRKLGDLGTTPCAHSSVPNAVSPTKSSPSSCDRARGQPPFPWCSCSSPVPGGVGGGGWGPGLTEQGEETGTGSLWRDRKRETSASHLDGKIPPILEIRMESPRQNMLAPLRLTIWLPQASLTLIQSNPSEWVSLCLLQHTPNKRLANTNSNKRSLVYCVSAFRCSWSSFFFFFMGNSYNPEQELTVSHDVLASSYCSHSSCYHKAWGCCSVYFLLISTAHFHSFAARGVGSQWSAFIQHQLFPLRFKAYHDTFEPAPHPPWPSTPDPFNPPLSSQTRRVLLLLILLLELSNQLSITG